LHKQIRQTNLFHFEGRETTAFDVAIFMALCVQKELIRGKERREEAKAKRPKTRGREHCLGGESSGFPMEFQSLH